MKSPLACLVSLLATGSLGAQTLQLRPAVQVEFDAVAGTGYRIEGSSNLQQWSPAAPAILGAGTRPVEMYFPSDQAHQFYRVASHPVVDLTETLAALRATHNVPALGCAVIQSNRVVALGVTGVRKHGVTEPVTLQDHWHHGSMTKSMTAVLAAKLVDEGVITWTTKLADVFPEHAARRHAGWNDTTLEMLLTNSGGSPSDLAPSGIWNQVWNHPGTSQEQRLFLVEEITARAPLYPPGTKYEYANGNCVLAGAMMEKLTGRTWESLMREKFFQPLGMTTAGFGVPATPRFIDHPWGHSASGNTPVPVAPGITSDNPAAMGPSGLVHCSLIDFARYVSFQLEGMRGEGTWLQPSSYQKLRTPVHSNYAMGWIAAERPWGNGRVFTHTGSNTMWYTAVWMAPNRNWAVVAVCNMGGPPAVAATSAAVTSMIQRYFP